MTDRRRASRALFAALVALPWPKTADAEGMDVSLYRPSLNRAGIGTADGAQAPPGGTIDLAVGSDLALRPLVLHSAAADSALIARRTSVEPAVAIGLGKEFALDARLPVVVDDAIASGAPLPSDVSAGGAGPRAVAAGVQVPLVALGESRISARAEVAVPLASAKTLRGSNGPVERIGPTASFYVRGVQVNVGLSAEIVPSENIGTAQRRSAARAAAGLRVPLTGSLGALASVDARVGLPGDPPSGLFSGGFDVGVGRSRLAALAGMGMGSAVGTPSGWFALALRTNFDALRSSPSLESQPPIPAPAAEPATFSPGEVATKAATPIEAQSASPPRVEAAAEPPMPSSAAPGRATRTTALVAIPVPPVLFATGSDELDSESIRGLSVFAARLAVAGPLHLRIVGHADRRGYSAGNHALGLARARAVAQLLAELGVPQASMELESYGDTRPARGREASDADQLRDRRVEILILSAPPETREGDANGS